MATEKRNPYWDVVKGIAIIAVVLIHTTNINKPGFIVWRQFINFPVALFFFVSGYFCHADDKPYMSFAVSKFKRLMTPLFVVCVVRACMYVRFTLASGGSLHWQGIVASFFSYPLGWGYFVIALFQCYLLACLFSRLDWRRSFAVSGVCYVLTAAYLYVSHTNPQFRLPFRCEFPEILCTSWLPFFVLGLVLQKHRVLQHFKVKWVVPVLALLLCVSIATGLVWFDRGFVQLSRAQIRVPSVLISLVLAWVVWRGSECVKLNSGKLFDWLALLGRNSYFIYLWHWLVFALFRPFSGDLWVLMPISVLFFSTVLLLLIPERAKAKLHILGL